ncbi:(Fe-S)-binding protein [Thiolapillus sp.]
MISEAARCVKCGLCLAGCPTYQLSAIETMSPRGRIALVQALSQGQLAVDDYSHEVLGSCLLCRRCEAVCPSAVPFGALMDRGRELVRSRQGWKERLAIALLSRRVWMRLLARIGKAALPKATPLGKMLTQTRFDAPEPEELRRPRGTRTVGRVGLFTGCTGSLFDSVALEGATELLLQAGYEVQIPRGQACCGALDAHGGNAKRAARLLSINEVAFASAGELEAVVSIASGCGAQLAGYPALGGKHRDVCAFLAQGRVISRLRFRPLEKRAAVHLPCTLENVLHGGEAVLQLLERIPGLQIEVVGKKGECCGAGGTALLLRPEMAGKLRQPFVQRLGELSPDYVLSSNISCRLHLQAGADTAGVQFMHPVTLLAQQLIRG